MIGPNEYTTFDVELIEVFRGGPLVDKFLPGITFSIVNDQAEQCGYVLELGEEYLLGLIDTGSELR